MISSSSTQLARLLKSPTSKNLSSSHFLITRTASAAARVRQSQISEPHHQDHDPGPTEDDSHYPIGSSNPSTSISTSMDLAYVARYRDPSHHDDYTLSDHQDPYTFRARPNATQPLPFTRRPPSFDAAQTSFEARGARLEMERAWASPSPESTPQTLQLSVPRPRIGLCFPGSGSQYIGMGSFLAHSSAFQNTWNEAEQALVDFERWRQSLDLVDRLHALGYSSEHATLLGGPMRRGALLGSGDLGLKHVVVKGPRDELTRSSNAQPAILITSLAYLRALEADYRAPILSLVEGFAGHSSGEYTACAAAGVLSFANAVHLTRLHGLLTTRTLELNRLEPSTALDAPAERRAQMSALLINAPRFGVSDIVRVLAEDTNSSQLGPVEIASINSKTQVVLSGSRAGVLAACERLHELDIAHRAADLPCAAPFHCSFMTPAADAMAIALAAVPFHPSTKPILFSSPPGQNSQLDLRTHLSSAIRSPVWWSTTVTDLPTRASVNTLVFVGPGKALSNLCRKAIPDGVQRVMSLATAHDFENLAKEIL